MHRRKVTFDWWEAIVEIDDTAETKELMKEQLLFWTNGQRKIDAAGGDVELVYLEMLGKYLITVSMGRTLEGVLYVVEESEGWCSLRGKYGIKLISVDSWEFETESFIIAAA